MMRLGTTKTMEAAVKAAVGGCRGRVALLRIDFHPGVQPLLEVRHEYSSGLWVATRAFG